MANRRALTLQSGVLTNIVDADTLIVGAGITTAAGGLSIASATGVTTAQDRFVFNNKANYKLGTVSVVSEVIIVSGGNVAVETGSGITVRYMETLGWTEGSEVTIFFDNGANYTFLSPGSPPADTAVIAGYPVGYFNQSYDSITFVLVTLDGVQQWKPKAQGGSWLGGRIILTGSLSAASVASTGGLSAGGDLSVTGNGFFGGEVDITGNLTVRGTTFSTQSETVTISDNHLYLNSGYATVAAQSGGLVVNYLPTMLATTIGSGVNFNPGVPATSNPTVTTVGSNTFSAGNFIQFVNSNYVDDLAGVFEVLSHVGTTLTIRGVGLTACVEDFTQNQFPALTPALGVTNVRMVTLSVMRAGTDGIWESAKGASTPLAFIDVNSVCDVAGTSGEALSVGQPVSWDDSSGPKVFRSDANGSGELLNVVGICLTATGGSGSSVLVRTAGEVAIPDAIWDAVPATSDVGKRVYLSETVGKVTITAPTAIGSVMVPIGTVSVGGTGAVKIIVQLGNISNENLNIATIQVQFSEGGTVLSTGVKIYVEVPFNCVIQRATLLADVSGSLVVDVWKDSYANYPPTVADTITASAKPTLSSAIKSQDSTLTGWTKTITAGEILGFKIDSATTVTFATLSLRVIKTP